MFLFLFRNGYTLNIKDRKLIDSLVTIPMIFNPLEGFHVTYQELLDDTYYLVKELHMSVHDIDDMTYEWVLIMMEKLIEDKKEEEKKQKEEEARQKQEYEDQKQMMNNYQNNYNPANYNPGNYNIPNYNY